jgi:hypothetical protein
MKDAARMNNSRDDGGRAVSMLISSFGASQSGQELYLPEISGHCGSFERRRS